MEVKKCEKIPGMIGEAESRNRVSSRFSGFDR